ncbi:MAG TPA: SMC-Scp complex subunit ScpB, partial [Gaiellaceae bacterium]|nr:SMC-Scp complex subunit ScpB [Gaiellaceae bacterium]
MDRPLRLISTNPVDQLARTIEALLVVATAPLPVDELAQATADSAVAGLLERGLIAEAGREDGAGGAVRYRTTALFERVFGLDSLSA